MLEFPISGVIIQWWMPILVACIVSCLTSMAGLSGAFVLLPYQVSILKYTAPGVTPTNLLFNIIATPGGIYRLYQEKRMVWPLVWTISAGTLPGVLLGVLIRVRYLPDPSLFKLFVGCVLFLIAIKLFFSLSDKNHVHGYHHSPNHSFEVTVITFTIRKIVFSFNEEVYQVSTVYLLTFSALVGIIAGVYGIGGGAIMAPFLVTTFGLPVYTIIGATLFGNFLTSVFGVLFYVFLGPLFAPHGLAVHPDWLLGTLFGIGGFIGIYAGARFQKRLPAPVIKLLLALIMLYIAFRYIMGYFA